jgi:hypothetical protein
MTATPRISQAVLYVLSVHLRRLFSLTTLLLKRRSFKILDRRIYWFDGDGTHLQRFQGDRFSSTSH